MNHYRTKAAALLLSGVLLAGGLQNGHAAAAPSAPQPKPVSIVLDDVPLPLDTAPVVMSGVTLLPFRTVAEALGVGVSWDPKNQTVAAAGPDGKGGQTQVALKVGSRTASVNGTTRTMAGAPIVRGGRVLIPLAFFSQAFGAQVSWDGPGKTVRIVSPRREMELLAFYALGSYGKRSYIPSFSEIAFGWSSIDSQGNWSTTAQPYRWPQPDGDVTPESIVADAAAAGTTPYLMVYAGDKDRELTKVLSDAALREASIAGIVETVGSKGFKGVVLDYEGLGWKDEPSVPRKLLNDYARALRKRLPDGVKLSLAVSPPNGAYRGYDYAALAKTADHLILMAYKYTLEEQPEPIDRVDEAIRQTLKLGVPKRKLMLGILNDHEDERSLGAKLGLAKRYGLRGAAFWRLGDLSDAEKRVLDDSVARTS